MHYHTARMQHVGVSSDHLCQRSLFGMSHIRRECSGHGINHPQEASIWSDVPMVIPGREPRALMYHICASKFGVEKTYM